MQLLLINDLIDKRRRAVIDRVDVLLLLSTYICRGGNRCLTNALVQQLPNAGVIAAQDKFDYRDLVEP